MKKLLTFITLFMILCGVASAENKINKNIFTSHALFVKCSTYHTVSHLKNLKIGEKKYRWYQESPKNFFEFRNYKLIKFGTNQDYLQKTNTEASFKEIHNKNETPENDIGWQDIEGVIALDDSILRYSLNLVSSEYGVMSSHRHYLTKQAFNDWRRANDLSPKYFDQWLEDYTNEQDRLDKNIYTRNRVDNLFGHKTWSIADCTTISKGIDTTISKEIDPNTFFEKFNMRSTLSSMGPQLRYWCGSYPNEFFKIKEKTDKSITLVRHGDQFWDVAFLGNNKIVISDYITGATYNTRDEVQAVYISDKDEWWDPLSVELVELINPQKKDCKKSNK